ncbi:MAG: ABC transporter permease [Acidimicrobiia bacterium]|nr:ABC transporter permease [Acidimicrobiia bacterium]
MHPATAETRVAVIEKRFVPPRWLRRTGSVLLRMWAYFALVFLFLPIAVVVLFSFNDPVGKFNLVWKGFSLEAWQNAFAIPGLTSAFFTSLQVGAVSTVFAVIIGSLIALALVRYRYKGGAATNLFLVLPLTAPEVVLGSSLLVLFLDMSWPTGFSTIVVAHISFQISFVAVTVKARLRGFDWTLEDAAMDLGSPPLRTFLRVTFPLILPGIIAAAMLAFALSLDDFIVTFFVSGSEVTYPLFVNSAVKTSLPPQINVLATIILLVSLALIGLNELVRHWRTRGLPVG